MTLEWLRTYLGTELDNFTRSGLSDTPHSSMLELRRDGPPPATIRITLSRKVADELQAAINSGDNKAEDFMGNALAQKIRRHLKDSQGAELDSDIRID
jgi:hypothetical protein